MLRVQQLTGFGGAAGGAVQMTTVGNGLNSTATASYTYNSVNLGASTAIKHIVVMTSERQGTNVRTLNTFSINGVGGTIIGYMPASDNFGKTYACIMQVPANTTTGTVVLGWSGSVNFNIFQAWELVGLQSTAYTDIQGVNTGPNPMSLTLNIQPGGVGMAQAMSNGAGSSMTWTGLTEDSDLISTSNNNVGSASTSTSGAISVVCTPSIAFNVNQMLAIAFR
jgi:hypothetical protein